MHQLRPYQKQSIKKIRAAIIKGKRKVLLVAATGSGKTVIAAEMIRRVVEGDKRCIFVCHRRELIMQCSRKLHELGLNHGVIMAGKSPTPDALIQVMSIQTYTARKENNDFIIPKADLIIIDEAQNISLDNIRTLMTRIGDNSKMVILGDVKQKDIRNKKDSSLEVVLEKFKDVDGFGCVELRNPDDVVRNPIIKTIEEVFEKMDN